MTSSTKRQGRPGGGKKGRTTLFGKLKLSSALTVKKKVAQGETQFQRRTEKKEPQKVKKTAPESVLRRDDQDPNEKGEGLSRKGNQVGGSGPPEKKIEGRTGNFGTEAGSRTRTGAGERKKKTLHTKAAPSPAGEGTHQRKKGAKRISANGSLGGNTKTKKKKKKRKKKTRIEWSEEISHRERKKEKRTPKSGNRLKGKKGFFKHNIQTRPVSGEKRKRKELLDNRPGIKGGKKTEGKRGGLLKGSS